MAVKPTYRELEQRIKTLEKELDDCRRTITMTLDSENLLQKAIDRAPVMVWTVDQKGRLTSLAGAGLIALTSGPGQILDQPLSDVFADHPEIISDTRRALAEEEFFSVLDHKGRILECHYTPLRDRSRKTVGAIGVATDVTKQMQNEARYRGLFENAPTSLWEEDLSAVKAYIVKLRRKGVKDFNMYFDRHPESLAECAALIKIVDINQTTLDMYGATHKEELLSGLERVFNRNAYEDFKRQLVKIANGKTGAESEIVNQTLTGAKMHLMLRWFVAPGHEASYSKVFLALTDITDRVIAEKALKESEETFRTLTENSPNMIFINLRGKLVYANKRCEEIMGYTRDEFYAPNFNFFSLIASESVDLVRSNFKRHAQGEDVEPNEYTLLNKAGQRIESIITTKLIDYQGEQAILGIVTDISKQKRTELALENSRRDWENIFQAIGSPAFILDPQQRIIAANRVTVEKTGMPPQELMRKRCYEVFHGISHPPGSCPMQQMMNLGQPQTHEVEMQALGRTYLITCTPVADDAGRLEKIIHIATDITDRKQAEEALRKSEQKYRSLYDNMRDGFAAINLEGKIIEFNVAFEKLLRYRSEEIYKLTYEDITPAKWHPVEARIIKDQVFPRGYSDPYEKEYKRKDGSIVPVELRTYLIRDEKGEPAGMWAFIRDISNWKRWEVALQESESKFRSFFDLSPQAVARIHFETWQVADVNQKFCELFKTPMDEILTRTMEELGLCTEEQVKTFVQRLEESGLVDGLEMDFTDRDGRMLTTLIFARLMQIKKDTDILIIFNDITERKKLWQQLQRAQRMEALGTLAGGIAHDFNNLLMGILGNVSLMLSEMGPQDTKYEQMKNIESYVHSAAALTKQLLGFAQGGKYEVKPTNINDLIARNAHMFGRTKKEINIHKKLQEAIWTMEVDQGQIDQVLLNLYVNAWQAMPAGGHLYIQTENIHLDESIIKAFDVRAGRYVRITITDSGVGMDAATQQRIFEPFFTTKELGRGTGLGLASAYGIIKNHGGFIDVHSTKGKGTTFSIYLPVGERDIAKKMNFDTEILRGKETILLVDDEDLVIDIGQKMLAKMGYETLIARGGQETIEVYRQHGDRIDLTILDMIMPDMNGRKTYESLKKLKPALKVLLSSGYSLNDQARKIMDLGCQGFIQKPFDVTQLSRKIREILDRSDE